MDVNSESVVYWVEQLFGKVDACDSCQPIEAGEIQWVEGEPQSVRELLDECGVPERLHDAVASELHCGCGNTLQLDSEIVVDGASVQVDEAASERFGWWVVEDNPRLVAFVEYLKEAPRDGRSHDVGRDIYSQMKELKSRSAEGVWWRARGIDVTEGPPTSEKLGPPPEPTGVAGRYNRGDQRVFYLGSNKQAVIAEVSKHLKPNRRLWLQQFRVVGVDGIVELKAPGSPSQAFYDAQMPSLFAGLLWCDCLAQQREGDDQSDAYLLPQYVADCAAELGVRGIVFSSQLHVGTNLVLFDWKTTDVVAVGVPEQAI